MFEHTPLYGKEVTQRTEHLPPPPVEAFRDEMEDQRKLVSSMLGEAVGKLDFEKDFDELDNTLGNRQVLSVNYPLASNIDLNFYDDEPAHIPGVVRLGSRLLDCRVEAPLHGTNVVGAQGQILFYRTRRTPDEHLIPGKRGEPVELYHEAGFFALALAIEQPGSSLITPAVAFGDIDRASWQSEGLKLQAVETLNRGDEARSTENPLWYRGAESQLFGESTKGVFRQRQQHGVFTQNLQPFIDTPMEHYNIREQVRRAMQVFIDDHSVPEQMAGDNSKLVSKQTVHPDPNITKVAFDKKYTGIRRSWSELQAEQEHYLLPFVAAVAEADMEYYPWPNYLERPLRKLLHNVADKDLMAKLQSTELTDDEIRTIHNCREMTHSVNSGGHRDVFVSPTWKRYVEAYPHLYKGLDLEGIAEEELAHW